MPLVFLRSLGLLALSLSLSHSALGKFQSPSSVSNSHPSPDESAISALVDKYFSAYGKKDLAGVVALWSEKSPDLATNKQRLQQQLTSEGLSYGSPTISRVKTEGEMASLRVTIALTSINLKSWQAGEQKMVSNLELVKEGGEWKVWRFAAAAEDLAVALVKADTEAERAMLLAEEKELVTVELGRAILMLVRPMISRGSYQRAIDLCKLVLKMAERLGDNTNTAEALRGLGNAHRLQGNYIEALEYYQNSLKASRERSDKAGIAAALNNIGLIYMLQGNYTEALEQYQRSLSIKEEIGDRAGTPSTMANIGLAQRLLGNYTEGLEQFRKSLKLFEEFGDRDGIARTLNNIGLVYDSQGNYTRAMEQYRKSLSIFGEIGERAGIATALNNVGLIHLKQGNYAQALEFYRESLRIKKEIGNSNGICITLNNIGEVYSLQGNYSEALEQYRKSLSILEETDDKANIAIILNSIGEARLLQGDYPQALEQYRKGLRIFEEIGHKAGIAGSLNNISETIRLQGNHTQALQFAGRAAELASQIDSAEVMWKAHTNAGEAYFALEQFDQARQSFDQAIATIEALRTNVAGGEREQQRSFESKISVYHAMVELLIAQKNPGEALIYAERARARVLLDVLSSGRISVTKTMTSQEIEQERELKSELFSLNTQIYREQQRQQPDQDRLNQFEAQLQKARLDLENFQTNLYVAHPELRPQRGEAPIIKTEEIAALLPDAGSVLLEYVVTDDRTYLFAITKAAAKPEVAVRVYTLPIKRDELAKRTENFRQQIAGRDFGFRAPARQLYQLLLKPAQAQIQGKKNLIIVPDDKLWELPFQALKTQDDRYLIESSAISYAPSLTVLREMKARHNRRHVDVTGLALLAMGNPALGKETKERATIALRDGRLDPLPEAEREVKALRTFYGASRSKVYLGKEAREDRVKSEAVDARILHFATHGTLNNASPMYSHLVLAQGGANEDGLLEAWELMEMDLKAELAVLSACETARGRYGAGEGMIGLTWALFVAGVPATVVSQWKVESAGTRDLMMGFHRELRGRPGKTRVSKAEALRLAALKLMENPATNHPFYWAGFVLVGDGN
jgi:CHAT domain-containing protein/tetratricopeptide (TPR) repeat protein